MLLHNICYTTPKISGALTNSPVQMALKANELQCRLCIIALVAVFVKQTYGQTPTATSDYFAPLEDLRRPVPHRISSQNFTRCCLRALDEWYKNPKNPDIIVESSKNPSKIFSNADDLSNTKPEEQFPCGAQYDGSNDGATRVKISYTWCKSNCGGWQRSRSAVLEQWVQPFVGFILPAAVFCLNVMIFLSNGHSKLTKTIQVPRKMVIEISDDLFPNVLEDIKKEWNEFKKDAEDASILVIIQRFIGFVLGNIVIVLQLFIRALLAAAIGLINVVVWVLVVFSAAAPMILSGLYEATIDRQVLGAIEKDILGCQDPQNKGKVEDSQNGEDHPGGKDDKKNKIHPKDYYEHDKDDENDDPRIEKDRAGEKQSGNKKKNDPSRVRHQIHLLYAVLVGNLKLRKTTDKKGKTPVTEMTGQTSLGIQGPTQKHPDTQGTSQDSNVDRAWDDVSAMLQDLDPLRNPGKYEKEKEKTATRLKTMLGCQASFGATIGAPVVFFLGSFLFSVFGNSEKLGDSDISLSLAFGEWWMIIPHVAIVSGCLLAGNNPNTLEAIVSGIEQVSPPKDKSVKKSAKGIWTPFYKSVYQPVWMWERGRNKRNWIQKVQALVQEEEKAKKEEQVKENLTSQSDKEPRESEESKKPSWWRAHWRRCLSSTKLEDVPRVGRLGWTFLVLTASVLIVIPFVLAYVTSFYTPTIGLSCRTFTFVLYFIFQSLLTIVWFYDFSRKEHHTFYDTCTCTPTAFYFVTFLFFLGSSFTAIVGTFMQILGVYRNCLCNIPMGYWGSRDFHFTVSSNSADGIYYARLYWLSTAIASICLLIIFCYLGWWYQRHWRARFNKVVEDVLDVRLPKKKDRRKRRNRTKDDNPIDKSGNQKSDQPKEENVKNARFSQSGVETKEKQKAGVGQEGLAAEERKQNQQSGPVSKPLASAPLHGEVGIENVDVIERINEETK